MHIVHAHKYANLQKWSPGWKAVHQKPTLAWGLPAGERILGCRWMRPFLWADAFSRVQGRIVSPCLNDLSTERAEICLQLKVSRFIMHVFTFGYAFIHSERSWDSELAYCKKFSGLIYIYTLFRLWQSSSMHIRNYLKDLKTFKTLRLKFCGIVHFSTSATI